MRSSLTILLAAALLVAVAARCPNSCSGHGDCGVSDKCSCWANWQGADCSERTCEYDIAWATDYRQDAHYYAECSAKGICDRSTGLCVCFEGYTGSACKRSVCPNDCSGHGKCRLVSDLGQAAQGKMKYIQSDLDSFTIANTLSAANNYVGWDADKIQACVCDGEFYGPDCSQRYCPKGDDPLTACAENVVNSDPKLTKSDGTPVSGPLTGTTHQVQEFVISTTTAAGGVAVSDMADFDGDLVLHFTDNHGEVWTTARIASLLLGSNGAAAATKIENALEKLPNFKIPSITVTGAGSWNAGKATFLVTFDNQRNSGRQQLLACDPLPLGCHTDGCSPKYQQLHNWNTAAWAALSHGTSTYKANTAGSFGAIPAGITEWKDDADYLNFFTADSIFDNSDTGFSKGYDQARVQITITKVKASQDAAATLSLTYSVKWDKSGTWSTDITDPYFYPSFVPAGYSLARTDTAAGAAPVDGSAANQGLGWNHVPIGYGMYVDLKSRSAGLAYTGADDNEILKFEVVVATARCHVTEYRPADASYEDLECSGRGTCDRATGTCSCFEGHFGDHCGLQTILV